jgi:hypothetical protein
LISGSFTNSLLAINTASKRNNDDRDNCAPLSGVNVIKLFSPRSVTDYTNKCKKKIIKIIKKMLLPQLLGSNAACPLTFLWWLLDEQNLQ